MVQGSILKVSEWRVAHPCCYAHICKCDVFRQFYHSIFYFISGATNPEYVVTADDVDKFIACECIPMDEQGRQVM